jgi:iron only hydrogenase large subunit-like protein
VGADICADNEAREFEERMKRGDKMMTTSCCSAYVRAVRKHVQDLVPCVSETRSPMHYTAEIAKKADPDCITVFIGPCLAKKREGLDDDLVDYVLTAEEISAFFEARGIDAAKMDKRHETIIPTASGRNFAKSGGVLEAVEVRLKDKSILRPAKINGLSKSGMKVLNAYGLINSGKIPSKPDTPNLIEVMACEGGCIAGPSVVSTVKQAENRIRFRISPRKFLCLRRGIVFLLRQLRRELSGTARLPRSSPERNSFRATWNFPVFCRHRRVRMPAEFSCTESAECILPASA